MYMSIDDSYSSIVAPGSSPVAEIWRKSGLRQVDLARRAGLPRSVLNAYIRGGRRPRADVLARIAAAAGLDLQLGRRKPPVDAKEASRRLEQVLGLAEALPYRPRARLEFPGLPGASGGS